MECRIKVWGTREGTISPLIYGHFIEHLGRCIYGGVFDEDAPCADARGFRKDVIEAMKQIKCPILRWPGGNFASAYHWEDGVGPKEKRPALLNYVWGGVETNRFGTDEFIEYCREIGAEPYITVSLGTGTLDEALHWLEYCNLDTPTKYAAMRKAFGHSEPYKVKYWGVGNEVYGHWQVGHCNASEYAEKLRQYAMFMKALDPSIKIIAVGADNPEWDIQVLKHAGRFIDFISIHQYHGSDEYYDTVAAAYYVEERLRLLENLIKGLGFGHVKIAFDEWNVWYRVSAEEEAEKNGVVFLEEPYNLKDALFAAGVFLVLHRMSDIVGMANLAQMVNALGMLKTSKDTLILTPIYHVFDLFVNHTGRVVLGLDVNTEYYAIKAKSFVGGRQHFELSRVPYFDASATYDPGRNLLCLAMVNYYKEKSVDVEVDLSDFGIGEKATCFELGAEDPFVMNDFENPERIKPMEKTVELPGENLVFRMVPHSLCVLEIPLLRPLD